MFKSRLSRSGLNVQVAGIVRVVSGSTLPPEEDVPWLSADQLGSWVSMVAMLMTLPPAIDAQLKRDSGINFFEYSILVALARPDAHAMRLTSLALVSGGSLSRLSHAISRMEKQGWVTRKVTVAETRCTEAVLTDEGMALLESAAPGHVREVRRLVVDVLSGEQFEQMGEACRAVVEVVSPETGAVLKDAALPNRS
jgi:DNA-binding MarR family transcriptional regulator